MILTVDLAAKFTAWMVTDETRQVHREGDSLGLTRYEVAETICKLAQEFQPEYIFIEDVPYGIKGQFQTKPVIRLQGAIIDRLHPWFTDRTFFINPATWQRAYKGVARGEPKVRVEAARAHAERLGYTPPNLVKFYADSLPEGTKVFKKDTKDFEKVMTDYVDAYLIADFAWENLDIITELSGVQPVNY